MKLLLVIKHQNYFARTIVTNTDSVLTAIESTDNRIHMCDNDSSLTQIEQIQSGKIKPLVTYLAGNNYFGKVIFTYTKSDGKTSPKKVFYLRVKVYSALGTTIPEHDKRYKRLKEYRYQKLIENRANNV